MRTVLRFVIIAAALMAAPAQLCSGAYIGWAVGDGGVLLRSADGGNTWTDYSSNAGFHGPPLPYLPDVNTVAFADFQNGWIAGDNGLMMHTSNGGTTWSTQSSST